MSEREEEFHNKLNKVEKRINKLEDKLQYYIDLSMAEYGESKEMYEEVNFKIGMIDSQLDRVKRKWERLISQYYGLKVNEIMMSYLSYLIVGNKNNTDKYLTKLLAQGILPEDLRTIEGIAGYLKDYSILKSHI